MDSYLGRFENAITLLQNDPDYSPNKVDIQKTALLNFVSALHQSNNKVSLLTSNLRTLRTKRNDWAYKYSSATPNNSLESIMDNILNYVGAENSKEHSVYKAIKGYLTKIRPKAKNVNADGSKSPSRSEKTFTALESYFEHTVHLLNNSVGLSYNPSNATLQLANLTTLANDFATLNRDITVVQKDEKTARDERRDLFQGSRGAKNLAKDIKMYLSSYPGGKHNAKYLQFVDVLG
jgi:predicted  nucleic acid-binding Zn-ribbon protein